MLDQLFFLLLCFFLYLDGVIDAVGAVTTVYLCCGDGCGDLVMAAGPPLVAFRSNYVGVTAVSAMVVLVTICWC